MELLQRWQKHLDDLRAANRYRRLTAPHGLDFSSNDYLGYGARSVRAAQIPEVLGRSGMASRLLRGHQLIWEEVEAALAEWHGAEAALMFTSGYCANEGLLSTIIEPGDFLASDRLNHSSLIDGTRLAQAGGHSAGVPVERFIYSHQDFDHLEKGLQGAAKKRRRGQQLFVVTEALFSMDGDRTPLLPLAELCERFEAHLIVDEAHSTGCFGPHGTGCVDELELRARVLATVHTGGKALGVCGAYVCGSQVLKELLVNRCRHLIFTTALPPVIAGWWLELLQRVRHDHATRDRLHANTVMFRTALAKHGCVVRGTDYIVPVILGDDHTAVRAATGLQELGYDIRAIRPPTVPAGTARLRISIHADHDPAVLQHVADAVAEACR